MSILPTPVQPLAEVRERLSAVVAQFRKDGGLAAPVVFGTHRKPEAVLLSYDRYHALIEELENVRSFASAFASVRAEGLEPTPAAILRAERVLRGELTDDEAYQETVRHYRRS